jgi:hypothetical protein
MDAVDLSQRFGRAPIDQNVKVSFIDVTGRARRHDLEDELAGLRDGE